MSRRLNIFMAYKEDLIINVLKADKVLNYQLFDDTALPKMQKKRIYEFETFLEIKVIKRGSYRLYQHDALKCH